MVGDLSHEQLIQKYLQGELKILNAHVPRQQKNLTELLGEEFPHIKGNDGNAYLFKKKELQYLTEILDTQEQTALFLPMLIELGESQDEVNIICKTGIEEKVINKVLGVSVSCQQGKIRIYKSQLGVLRKTLRTTTQYVYTVKLSP